MIVVQLVEVEKKSLAAPPFLTAVKRMLYVCLCALEGEGKQAGETNTKANH